MNSSFPETELPIAGTRLCWVDHLPESLPNAVTVGRHIHTKPGELLITFPQLARFRVSQGQQIDVMVLPGGTHDEAAFFLMATPFGALIHQRGELPLHAAAVVPPNGSKALLIAGQSGAGKSTTAAAFAKCGWRVLNDDISRIEVVEDEVLVWPGFTALKLWKQSCEMLQLDSCSLPRTRGMKEKFFWQPPVHKQPVAIAAIVELQAKTSAGETTGLSRLRGGAAIQMLVRQTFRPRLIRPLGCQTSHFAQLQQSAGRLSCYQFNNSHDLTPDALVDQLTTLMT